MRPLPKAEFEHLNAFPGLRVVLTATLADNDGFRGHFSVYRREDDWLAMPPIFIEDPARWAIALTAIDALRRANLRANLWLISGGKGSHQTLVSSDADYI